MFLGFDSFLANFAKKNSLKHLIQTNKSKKIMYGYQDFTFVSIFLRHT